MSARGIKTSTSSIKKSESVRNETQLKEIDIEIQNLNSQIKELEEKKRLIILKEKQETLLEINSLMEDSGMTVAELKAVIKKNQNTPKKVVKIKQAKTITEQILKDNK